MRHHPAAARRRALPRRGPLVGRAVCLIAAAAATLAPSAPVRAADVFLNGGTFTLDDATYAADRLYIGQSAPTTVNLVTGGEVLWLDGYGTSHIDASGGTAEIIHVHNTATLRLSGTVSVTGSVYAFTSAAITMEGGNVDFIGVGQQSSLVATGGSLGELSLFSGATAAVGGAVSITEVSTTGTYTQTGGTVQTLDVFGGTADVTGGSFTSSFVSTNNLSGAGSLALRNGTFAVSAGTTRSYLLSGRNYRVADYQVSVTWAGGGSFSALITAAEGSGGALPGGDGVGFASVDAVLAQSLDLTTDAEVGPGIYDRITVGAPDAPGVPSTTNTVTTTGIDAALVRAYGQSTANVRDSLTVDTVESYDRSTINVEGGLVDSADAYNQSRLNVKSSVRLVSASDEASVFVTGGAATVVEDVDVYGNGSASVDATLEDAYVYDNGTFALDGGTVEDIFTTDKATVFINGGTVTGDITSFGDGLIRVNGGSVEGLLELFGSDTGRIEIAGGRVSEIELFPRGEVAVSGGQVDSLTLYNDSRATLSGGRTETVYGYDDTFTYLTGVGHLEDIYLYDQASFLMDGGTLGGSTVYLLGDGTVTFDFLGGTFDTRTLEQTGEFVIGGQTFSGSFYSLTGRLSGSGGSITTRYFLAAADGGGTPLGGRVSFSAASAPEPSAFALVFAFGPAAVAVSRLRARRV